MNKIIAIFFLLLLSCNDKPVSEEERKVIRQEIEFRKPVKISQEQIITKAFEEARQDLKDTVVTVYEWKTYYVKPPDSTLAELWQAYKFMDSKNAVPADNVQITDSIIIYTKPIIENDSLRRMLVAFLPKKEIIMKISDQ